MTSSSILSKSEIGNVLPSTINVKEKPLIVAIYLAGHIRTWCEYIKNELVKFMENGGCKAPNDVTFHLYVSTHTSTDRQEVEEFKKKNVSNGNQDFKGISDLFSGLPLKGLIVDSDTISYPFLYENKLVVDRDITNDKVENKIEVEPSTISTLISSSITTSQAYIWRMWRKVWQCNEMRKEYEVKNSITYDYIVRMRPDIIVMEKIDFCAIHRNDEIRNGKKIIIGFGSTLGYPDDMFAIGNPNVMNHYCDINKVYDPICDTHIIARLTIDKYPVLGYVQIGILRDKKTEERWKNIIDIDGRFDDRNDNGNLVDTRKLFLNFYEKSIFRHTLVI